MTCIDIQLCHVVNGVPPEVVDSMKFLGVTVDKHLTFTDHITNMVKKAKFVCMP